MSYPRNVLLIYTDQWRFDALGCAGNHEIVTPHLDQLAASGVQFTHCFVQHPLCMPSRYSMLCGRYPSSLNVTHMGVSVPQDAETLPRMLSRFGFYTANFGKLHFLPHANRDHRLPHPSYGFTHAEISDEPGVYDDPYRAWVRRHYPAELEHISRIAHPPAFAEWRRVMNLDDEINRPTDFDAYTTRVYPGDERTTYSSWVTSRTIDFLRTRQRDGQHFLCVASYYNPHSPLMVSRRFLNLYRDRSIEPWVFPPELQSRRTDLGLTDEHLRQAKLGYYAMCSEVDHHVGTLLAELRSTGLLEKTLVVFTSDHGEFLGEHLRWGKSYPVPDCVSRVPLLFAGAGVAAGTRCDACVEAVDIVPTLLAALGKPLAPTLEGRSLLAAIQNGAPPVDSTDALTEDVQWKALRTPDHRYIFHLDGREELFDLSAPFGEYRDIASDPRSTHVLADCRRRLLHKLFRKERPIPREWPY